MGSIAILTSQIDCHSPQVIGLWYRTKNNHKPFRRFLKPKNQRKCQRQRPWWFPIPNLGVFGKNRGFHLRGVEGLGVGVALPTEPLIVGMMLVFILKLFFDGGFEHAILKHPVTKFVIIHIAWMSLTTVTSTDPLVSLKFLLSRIWFVSVFYFIASQVLKSERNQRKVVWLYV